MDAIDERHPDKMPSILRIYTQQTRKGGMMKRQDNSQDYVKKIYDELISRGLSTEEASKIASQAYISDTPHIEPITSGARTASIGIRAMKSRGNCSSAMSFYANLGRGKLK